VPPDQRDDIGADQADVAEADAADQSSTPVDVGRVGVYFR
jgi:hypothetical protein